MIAMALTLCMMSGTAIDAKPKSLILEKLSQLKPSWMEFGWMADIVNIYVQSAKIVRAGTRLVENLDHTRKKVQESVEAVNEVWNDLKRLKEIEWYDMDTWEQGLWDIHMQATAGIGHIVNTMESVEDYFIYATSDYAECTDDEIPYETRYQTKKDNAASLLSTRPYQDLQQNARTQVQQYRQSLIGKIDRHIAQKRANIHAIAQQVVADADDMVQQDIQLHETQQDLARLEHQRELVRNGDAPAMTRTQDMIAHGVEMVSQNMADMELLQEKACMLDRTARTMQTYLEKMMRGDVAKHEREADTDRDVIGVSYDDNDYIGRDDPDKAPVPQDITDYTSSGTKSKNKEQSVVTVKDIRHVQNQIQYLRLRQEALLRDIEMKKATTLPYMVGMRGYADYKKTQDKQKRWHESLHMSHAIRGLVNE
jgi:hypothetical protein